MFGLIITLISIALFATIAAISINYIPIDALIAFKARSKAQEGMQSLAGGAVRYIKTVTDANGFISLPAQGTDLASVIEPTFAFIPAAPSGMGWRISSSSYGGLPAVAICLHPLGSVDDATQRGVQSIKGHFPPAAFFINNSCGAQTNGTGSFLTFWVVANHYAS